MRWLAAVATVIRRPRAASSPAARSRKPASDVAILDGAGGCVLQHLARSKREGLAAQQQAEPGRQGGEQGQAHGGGGDQDGIGPGGRHQDQQREDRQAQAGEDVPDARHQGVQHVVSGADTPAGQDRPADPHAEGAAGGQRVGHGAGAEIDHRGLTQP